MDSLLLSKILCKLGNSLLELDFSEFNNKDWEEMLTD